MSDGGTDPAGTEAHHSTTDPSLDTQTLYDGLDHALAAALARKPTVVHIIRERDVGLFSLIQQVIANIPWALREGRIPIADLQERTSYWTPNGRHGSHSVWEYYFEPIVSRFPASSIANALRTHIDRNFPDQNNPGYFVDASTYVSNHYGDHPALRGKAPVIPYTTGNPTITLRRQTAAITRDFVRPLPQVTRKVDAFYKQRMAGRDVIGVLVRGTDAVSAEETRHYRKGSLDLSRYVRVLEDLMTRMPKAKILVATDDDASLQRLLSVFGHQVIAYETVRHREGASAGRGPTGCIMPAYITTDREKAAQNGEDAVVEHLLLSRCNHLVHNGASLATTVLLREPRLGHTNTHAHA
jgi:hypothetical protein